MSWDGSTRRERRKGPDAVVKLITIVTVLGWISMIVTLFIYGMARPDSIPRSFWPLAPRMDRLWNTHMMSLVLYFLIGNFILGVTGLIINSRRHKRKSDHYSLSLLLLTILSVVGVLLVEFGYLV